MSIVDRAQTKRSSLLVNALFLAGGAAGSQLLIMLASPILTRLYSPEAFGEYSIALAVINIFGAIACLRYDLAVVLPRSTIEAVNLLILCVIASGATAAVSGLVAVGLAVVHVSGLGIALVLTPLVVIAVFLMGLQLGFRGWFVRRGGFRILSVAALAQSIFMLLSQLASGATMRGSAFWLLVGTVVGIAASVAVFWRGIPTLSTLRAITPRRLYVELVRYKTFPLFRTPFSFISQLGDRGLILVVSAFAVKAEVGMVALALRIIFVPLAFVSGSIEQVFYGHAARGGEDDELENIVRRIVLCSALFFGPTFVLSAFHMPAIFELVFGSQWSSAGRYATWLAFAGLTMLLTNWTTRLFDVSQRQKTALILEICYVAITFPLMGIMLSCGVSVLDAVIAFSIWRAMYSLGWLVFALRAALFSYKPVLELIAIMAATFAYCIAVNSAMSVLAPGTLAWLLIIAAASLPPMGLAAWLWSCAESTVQKRSDRGLGQI